jgi:hypothetical protein
MRKFFCTAVLLALVASGGVAQAQNAPATLTLPGSVSVTSGTLTPAEPDNVVSRATVTQGLTVWQRRTVSVGGFVRATVSSDTDHLPWNRTTGSTAGLRMAAVSPAGVLQVVAGVATDARPGQPRQTAGVAYADFWTNWRVDAAPVGAPLVPDSFPGHLYVASGVMTAAEPGNWLTAASFQQGAAVFRGAGMSLVPFVGGQAQADSAGYTWNNRYSADAGVKVTRGLSGGVVEVGVMQRREWDRPTGAARTRPAFFINFWLGWNPRPLGS